MKTNKPTHTLDPLMRDLTAAQSDLVRSFDGDSNDAEHEAAIKCAEAAGLLIQSPLHRAAPGMLTALRRIEAEFAKAKHVSEEAVFVLEIVRPAIRLAEWEAGS